MRRFFLWALLATQVALLAQIDRSPVPFPGQTPGGSGIPMPFPVPRRGKQEPSGGKRSEDAVIRTSGTLRKLDEKVIVLEAADARLLEFRRNAGTKFHKASREIEASDLKPGDRISVDATQDQRGYLLAVSVTWEGNASEATSSPAPVPRDPDDPGPPALKRGRPEPRQASEEVPELAPEPPDPYIEKARAAAEAFSEQLPDYVCKQHMARYTSTARPADWHAVDVISADVVYEKGRESYRNLAINGRGTSKSIEQLDGAWSTGEFGSILLDVLSPATAAEFRFRRQSVTAGIRARVYEFDVQQPNSHWHVMVASQSMYPAYKGSLWIEPDSGRVLRIELQARALPREFPMDTVESAVDYERIRIGGSAFLLPTHAETLSCQRDTPNCSRNSIDFRNYHKYEANSDIEFSKAN